MVEGINSTEGTGAFGNYVDYGSFRKCRSAAAHQRGEPGSRRLHGAHQQVGGNRYTGSFYGDYETQDWQSYNIDADQIAAGVSGGGGLEPEDINRLTATATSTPTSAGS